MEKEILTSEAGMTDHNFFNEPGLILTESQMNAIEEELVFDSILDYECSDWVSDLSFDDEELIWHD